MVRIILSALFFVACGCASNGDDGSPDIVHGKYVSTEIDSVEFLTVDAEKIFFHLIGSDQVVLERSYSYEIWPNKAIIPKTLASSEYFTGVGVYEWKLTEAGILRQHKRTKNEVLFIREKAKGDISKK